MLQSTKMQDNKLRRLLWPIQMSELYIFVPMVMLLFTLIFSQNTIRVVKDGIVAIRIAPETISFIKIWVELPFGVFFVLLYSKLVNFISPERLFRYILMIFAIYFYIFIFWVLPNVESLHLSPEISLQYCTLFPHFKWFIVIFSKWSYVLFYVIGELWPIIIITFGFYQLANKIINTTQAQRFYPFFGLFAHGSLILCGLLIRYLNSTDNYVANIVQHYTSTNNDDVMIKSLIIMAIFSIFVAIGIHKIIETTVMSNTMLRSKVNNTPLRLGLIKSIRMILGSRYLGLIAVLLLSYSMSVNLIEGLWMSTAKKLYKTNNEFMLYHSRVLSYVGVFCLICDIICNYTIRKFGWFIASIITPVVTLIVGTLYFISILMQDSVAAMFAHIEPLALMAFLGGLQNVIIKGVKYSLFDDTREMLYIPLDSEMKTKGKAAVDIVGTNIGKSSGSAIQFGIFTLFPNIKYESIAQYLLLSFVIIMLIWIYATCKLRKMYYDLLQQDTMPN